MNRSISFVECCAVVSPSALISLAESTATVQNTSVDMGKKDSSRRKQGCCFFYPAPSDRSHLQNKISKDEICPTKLE